MNLLSRRLALKAALGSAMSLTMSNLDRVAHARDEAFSDTWWQGAVIYEIYVRSFQDSNGDGIGDIKGIISRLDYLHDLGVDALWITPFYPSPLVDFGYDISNYRDIDPAFGTLYDFDILVREAKKRDIRILIDMVLNHTSDQHPWFVESRSSRTNPKADWYVWREPKRDAQGNPMPPNNWMSQFGGSSWEWVPERQQYYYHRFYKQQPDLNWFHPAVEAAMFDTLRFWMNRGVAGFRLDAITSIFEDQRFLDETFVTDADGTQISGRQFTDNLDQIYPLLQRMRQLVNEKPGTILLGETYLPTVTNLREYYGNQNGLQLAMDTRFGLVPRLTAPLLRDRIQDLIDGLRDVEPLIFFDNHDNERAITRFAPKAGYEGDFAKLLATVLMTPRATVQLYYGEEIGMTNHTPTRIEDVHDPVGRVKWPNFKGRDGERTPMQWDAGDEAGFTTGISPWLPIGGDYQTTNVASQSKNPNSILSFYKALLWLRRNNAPLKRGQMELVNKSNPDVLCLRRTLADHRSVFVACNLTSEVKTIAISGAHTLLGNRVTVSTDSVTLDAYGVFIAEIGL